MRESHASLGPRLRKAEDPDTPDHVLRELAHDPNPAVRLCVAENESTPVETLRLLAIDEPDIRFGVAGNESAPEDLLLLLSEDEDEEIAECAQATLAGLKTAKGSGVAEQESYSTPLDPTPWGDVLTGNQREQFLEGKTLVEESGNSGPLDLAEEPDTPVSILWYLGLIAEWEGIREAVASNQSAPAELLTILARDPSDLVRLAVQANPNASPEARRLFAEVARAESAVTPPEALLEMARSAEPLIRLRAAANPGIGRDGSLELLPLLHDEGLDGPLAWGLAVNPRTDPLVLDALARSQAFDSNTGDSVALLVAQHDNTTPEALAELRDCTYPDVQRVLASRT